MGTGMDKATSLLIKDEIDRLKDIISTLQADLAEARKKPEPKIDYIKTIKSISQKTVDEFLRDWDEVLMVCRPEDSSFCKALHIIKELLDVNVKCAQAIFGLEDTIDRQAVQIKTLQACDDVAEKEIDSLTAENAEMKNEIGDLRAKAVRKGLMNHGSFTGKP